MHVCKSVLSRFGLSFSETMYGRYTNGLGESGQFDFTVGCKAGSLYEFFCSKWRKRVMGLEGVLSMESSGVVCTAGISADAGSSLVLFERGKLKYEFLYIDPFTNENMLYSGSKNLDILHPLRSMTALYGGIYSYPGMVKAADVQSFFKMSELFGFLKSCRL